MFFSKNGAGLRKGLLRTKLIEKIYFIKSKCMLSKIDLLPEITPLARFFISDPRGATFKLLPCPNTPPSFGHLP